MIYESADRETQRKIAVAKAEAESITLKGKALHDNPNLVELTKVEKWNGVLPTTMVPGTTVPFMNVGTAQ